jgi:hypothetical protein
MSSLSSSSSSLIMFDVNSMEVVAVSEVCLEKTQDDRQTILKVVTIFASH